MTKWTWHRGLATGRYYVDNGDIPICDVANIQEAESTACLIAAAPELLEALKDCAADLEARIEHAFNEIGRHPVMQRDYEADISTVKDARAAIAKATGEAA